jgi:O-antigen ligase/Tfp pilus assembly protein PilF
MPRIAYSLFIVTLIFAPLAFGTVELWSYTVMELMICVSALFLFASYRQNKFYQVPGMVPLLLVCGMILFQTIPLPASLVQLISPETHQIYQDTLGAVSPVRWMPISIYPRSTLMTFICVSSYVLFYAIAVQFLSNAALLRKTLSILAGFGAVLAVFVIFEFFTKILNNYPFAHEKILFFRESVHGGRSVGPYVNRNHYAGLVEMIFPLVLGLFLVYRPVIARVAFKKQLADFFLQKRIHFHLLCGAAAVLIATSLFVTLSRGGILSLTLSMGMLALFLILKTNQKRVGIFVGIIFVMVFFLTGTDAWYRILARFESTWNEAGEISTGRFVYWADSIEIIKDFPAFGAGAGAFEYIYPKYRTYPGNNLLEHAHNDYLEFLATGGIIIAGLMLFALIFILYKAFQIYGKRREAYAIYIFVSALAAVFSILLHSFVEFNMQIGANGLYFFFILAVATSSANTRFRNGLPATYLKPSTAKFYIPLLAAFCLAAGVLYVNFGALLGNLYFSDFQNVNLNNDISSENLPLLHRAAQKAAAADPVNPEYSYILAKTSAAMKQADTALHYYKKSLRLAPLNSRYLKDAGDFLSGQGNHGAADQLMRIAISFDHHNPMAYFSYASWLFQENQMEKGLGILQSVMSLYPETTNTCLALMVWFGLNEEQMREALPDRVQPNLVFADYLVSKGNYEKAEASYVEALYYLSHENEIKIAFFLKVYQFFMDKKKYEKALHIIEQAIQYIPGDYSLHNIAGNLYETIGITYRADEEYRKASILKKPIEVFEK